MSGPFYGSLAASASVFVAILTALLVNNYIRIKSDRSQTQKELNRVEEEIDGLQKRKKGFEDTIQPLVDKREADYVEKAEERVDEFTESKVFWDIVDLDKPIEKLAVDELYKKLIEFHDCESPEELEEEPFEYRHRDVLEDRLDEIKDRILNNIIPSFASQYEGEGWDSNLDSDISQLKNPFKMRSDEENTEEELETETETDNENGGSDVLDLDEFIEKYKEQYDLSNLDDKTLNKLENQYNKVVDKPRDPEYNSGHLYNTLDRDRSSNLSDSLIPSGSLEQSISNTPITLDEAQTTNEPFARLGVEFNDSDFGLNPQEEQELAEAKEELRDIDIKIGTLQQRKDRLGREKERLQPEVLVPILAANVITIIFSVVVPIFAYLLFITNTVISLPSWLAMITHTEVNVFLSWLLGLCVVFESIHARINDRKPKTYSLYKSVRSKEIYLSETEENEAEGGDTDG